MGGTPEGVPYVLQVRLKADTTPVLPPEAEATPVLPPEGGSYFFASGISVTIV